MEFFIIEFIMHTSLTKINSENEGVFFFFLIYMPMLLWQSSELFSINENVKNI